MKKPIQQPETLAQLKARYYPSQMATPETGTHVMARVGPNRSSAAGSISFSHDAK